MLIDRRSGRIRRGVVRYRVNIDAEWETEGKKNSGTINDISTRGCFVACSGNIDNGKRVKVLLILNNGVKLPFDGKVVNHVFEIGFGMKFYNLKDEQKMFLDRLTKTLERKFPTRQKN